MRLATVRDANGAEHVARLEGDTAVLLDWASDMAALIAARAAGTPMPQDAGAPVPLAALTLLAPLRPATVLCVGLNYVTHAIEGGEAPPSAPLLFAKLRGSVVGPNDTVRWSAALATQVDYEAELVAVIGRRVRDVAVDEALDHVFGYTCGNDVSARDVQFGDGQWLRGKSFDTFAPIGPWIVTANDVPDPQALDLRLTLNGTERQRSSTSTMLFSVAEIVSYVSRHATLEPGDIVFTGTPEGVGVFRTPPVLLADGDTMSVEISGVGRLDNRCTVDP